MGDNHGSWFPLQHFSLQTSNMNLSRAPFPFGNQHDGSVHTNIGTNMFSGHGALPFHASTAIPNLQVGQPKEYQGWFYCLPCFRQAFAFVSSHSNPKEIPPSNPHENHERGRIVLGDPASANAKLVAFEQCRDLRTPTSGFTNAIKNFSCWTPKQFVQQNLDGGYQSNVCLNPHASSLLLTKEDNDTQVESEMHEDTEELNALLYSDDESYYSEDDEVTSTGHSPSTMTFFERQNQLEDSTEEVASSAWPSRKRKLGDGGYDGASLCMVTSSSDNLNTCNACDEDGNSSNMNDDNSSFLEKNADSANKRMRKENIHKTIRILQGMIPGGKDKAVNEVLDEAVDYLNSLKVKAEALGLTTL